MPTRDLWLLAIVALAFSVEGALGFGATVIAVALASMLMPIAELLPAFVPLNMVLSAYFAVRYRRVVRWDLLFRRVLPGMLAGLPFGIVALAKAPEAPLKLAFGVFVVALSAIELARSQKTSAALLTRGRTWGFLFLGGLIHGAFATGGPLAVYVLGRQSVEKTAFRATLAVLWLSLNVVLVSTYVALGKLGATSLDLSSHLALGLAVGLGVGELLHGRVPERLFRKLVFAMLAIAGTVLAIRAYR